MFYQQGDVLIKMPGEQLHDGQVFAGIPGDAIPCQGCILAVGVATGHAHRVIPETGTEQRLPPGDYEIERVREYDPFAEVARNVAD